MSLVNHQQSMGAGIPGLSLTPSATPPTRRSAVQPGPAHGSDTAEDDLGALDYGSIKSSSIVVTLEREARITKAYRAYESAHPYVREVEVLKVQVPLSLQPMRDGDWFAGRIDRPLVGIDPERGGLTEAAWFCRVEELAKKLDDPELGTPARELLDFWVPRQTSLACRARFSGQTARVLPGDDYYSAREIGYPMYGMGGPVPDYDKLVRLGIAGLRSEVLQRARNADPAQKVFLDCLLVSLDILADAARRYAKQARARASELDVGDVRTRYEIVAGSLDAITMRAPQSYHEAIQLVWLYAIVALPRNYGRLDITLGDSLCHDLDSKALSLEQAREMTRGLWRMIVARTDNFNNRIIVGGKGRRNERNADRFARLALEVQSEIHDTIPQLSVRWYNGMDRSLWDLSIDVIGQGSTFPILYNDDVNVAAVAEALGVSQVAAEQYVPYGCGEYVLQGSSVNSPDAALNVAKALDVTLRNGVDGSDGERRGAAYGSLTSFATFDELRDAFARQIEQQIAALAEVQERIYAVTAEQAALPLLSLLFDGCIERAKPLLAGGVRHLTGCLESFGNNTAADALYAIKRAVYDTDVLSAEQLLECLRTNFEGHAAERRILRAIPKYGNDHAGADEISLWVNGLVGELCRKHGKRVGLDAFQLVLVNNGDSVLFGKRTAATADGRLAGEPLSNGNQPSAGADKEGLTPLLNSMAKLRASVHAGATHNLKVSRGMFTARRAQMGALMRGYFAAGGTQAMLTVTDVHELEQALIHPEQYANLIVRVGGYSERFVDLPRAIQLEVVSRTLVSA